VNTFVSSKLRVGIVLIFVILTWLFITPNVEAKESYSGLAFTTILKNGEHSFYPSLEANSYIVSTNKSSNLNAVNEFLMEHNPTIVLILIVALMIVLSMLIRIIYLKNKIEKEKNSVINHLKGSYTELEVTHQLLVENEKELNRQFNEIQEQKNKLKISRERYKLAAEGAEFGIWDIDFIQGITYISGKGREIVHMDMQESAIDLLGFLKENVHPEDRKKVIETFFGHVKKKLDDFEVECRVEGKNEAYEWISIKGRTLFNGNYEVVRMAGSVNNISKAKTSEEKIKRLAFYDVLTGLPNRTYFELMSEEYIHREDIVNFALLLMDIDNFKVINDFFGHSYGDEILVKLVTILKTNLTKEMELFRFGGDEFILLISNISREELLRKYVKKIIYQFQKELEFEGLGFLATVSIGVATYPQNGDNVGLLLKRADVALNEVKSKGKNGYELFSDRLDKIVTSRLQLESDLRQAIIKKEFELYYQPKVITKEKKILGYEALIRWNHKGKKLVSPSSFIPVAEETGLIIKIGEWVIMEAIDQLKKWHDEGYDYLTIAINLSAKQLKDVNVVKLIESRILETGVDATKIELEITETTALTDINYSKKVLRNLKKLGIKISLDDFGTGYSALNYLTQLPIDTLKIDQSFIKNSVRNKSRKAIIKSVIKLAHECKMKVVAEGVETKSQFEFLENEQCDIIQGYYFSKPLPNQKAIQLLALDFEG
jgi:diguanylate cyclase (GGDEF)-like protein